LGRQVDFTTTPDGGGIQDDPPDVPGERRGGDEWEVPISSLSPQAGVTQARRPAAKLATS